MKMIQRVKNTRVGRLVCRLFGEEKGAVMMEYVIVAVLIAAAAVAAVIYFGKNITGMFATATEATVGNNTAAEARSTALQSSATTDANDAVAHNKKFSTVKTANDGEQQQQQ